MNKMMAVKMSMSDTPKELRVFDKDVAEDSLFGDSVYIIPRYQREYAWSFGAKDGKEGEISRLINDIQNFPSSDDRCYRLGYISVKERPDGKFEVIDGQQRLTTLYLLLTALNSVDDNDFPKVERYDIKKNPDDGVLLFEGRKVSTYTLQNAKELSREKDVDNGIFEAYKKMLAWAKNLRNRKDQKGWSDFKKNLQQTAIYRIPVPLETDLCKFFIRMNTRGKQLELSDVLKAQLMNLFSKNQNDLKWFDAVWTACSDMNTYLEKSLAKEHREGVLSKALKNEALWNDAMPDPYDNGNISDGNTDKLEVVAKEFFTYDRKSVDELTENVSKDFESFINFPTFLMHTLKLCALIKEGNEGKSFDAATNDERLLTFFEKYWEQTFDVPFKENSLQQSKSRNAVLEFLRTLVVARYLYDGWILKRLSSDDDSDNWSWSIQHSIKSHKKYKLVSSFSQEDLHERILMIQACMRVTYTSSDSMPWVTRLLHLLWYYRDNPDDAGEDVLHLLEEFAINEVSKQWPFMNNGTGTPRILFNYLDYILWKNEDDYKNDGFPKFRFAYWNSVEHWYPQNPISHTWSEDYEKKYINTFGNLFLLNSSDNSSLSNQLPDTKKGMLEKDKYKKKISLKARHMMQAMAGEEGWSAKRCRECQEEYINLFREEFENLIKQRAEKPDDELKKQGRLSKEEFEECRGRMEADSK